MDQIALITKNVSVQLCLFCGKEQREHSSKHLFWCFTEVRF